jgi:adenosylcobinamide-GDP ribazoletransferase
MDLRDDLASAFALLTRLPVPGHHARGAAAAWAWPVVGAAVGALGAVAGAAALALGAAPAAAAAAVLAAQALATGALHEDGLADTADGLGGGRDRARRLAIMKDSRIGTFGTLALLLVTLARWGAVAALLAAGGALGALVAAGALGRAPMAAVMAALPNARGEGLAAATGRPPPATAAAAAGLALAIAVVAAGWTGLAMALAAALAALPVALAAHRRIGGQTGDVLGATEQVAETCALAVA